LLLQLLLKAALLLVGALQLQLHHAPLLLQQALPLAR
jgi:hypothetical protein